MTTTSRKTPSKAEIRERTAGILANLDRMPADAEISMEVVCALKGVAYPTGWRMLERGEIPAPIRTGRLTRFRLGDFRQRAKAA